MVCVAAIVLCCTQCAAPADTDTTTITTTTATTTSTLSNAESVSTTTATMTTTTTIHTSGIVLAPNDDTNEAEGTAPQETGTTAKHTTKKPTTKTTTATKKTTAKTSGGGTASGTIALHVKTTYYGVEGCFCTLDCSGSDEELLTKLGIFPDKTGATAYTHYTEYYDVDDEKEVWFICYADKQVGPDDLPYFQVNIHTKQPPTTTTTTITTTSTQSKYHEYPNGFPDVDVEISIYEEYMLELINEGRAKEGLKPLKMNTYYHDLAEIRAEEATRVWSHTRPNGTKWWTVYEDAGRAALGYSVGENLATGFEQQYGFTTIKSVYDALYASEGHRANMMNPVYTEVALAIHWEEATSNLGNTAICGTMAQLFIGPAE